MVGNTEAIPSFAPGATPEQLEDFNRSYRRWGQGTARITLLPGRKNLLAVAGESSSSGDLVKKRLARRLGGSIDGQLALEDDRHCYFRWDGKANWFSDGACDWWAAFP